MTNEMKHLSATSLGCAGGPESGCVTPLHQGLGSNAAPRGLQNGGCVQGRKTRRAGLKLVCVGISVLLRDTRLSG